MARYSPWTKGRYDVAPGLKPLGTDFGNGKEDQQLFQFGADSDRLLENKRLCLIERSSKYVARHQLSTDVEAHAAELIRTHLSLSDELSLEELAMQVPEDLAIVTTDSGSDWLAFGHLCAPSHWAIEEKIGCSFATVHDPVPGFERTSAVASKMMEAMIHRGPFVRFVWSLESDNRPNHHPTAPPGFDQEEWWGRQFDLRRRFWVRVERQCLVPMPTVSAALFTIRLSWWDMEEVCGREELRLPLLAAVQGMSSEERTYKGIESELPAIIELLS